MKREEWSTLSDPEKLDYLFNWNERLEEAIKRLDVTIQMLDARIKISADWTRRGTGPADSFELWTLQPPTEAH